MILLLIFFTTVLFSQQKSDRPVAVNDSVTMMQYGTVEINVLANDYDPNGLAIFIEEVEVEGEEGFEVSFQDSIVSITALEYYDYSYARFDYCIENESGETDCADILVYFEENPEVPKPNRDIFNLQCQKSQVLNLIENDEYNGLEDLIIVDLESTNVEISEDQQSVRYNAGVYTGHYRFSYRIKEVSGNEYISKEMNNFVFIKKNPEAPIGVADTFNINMGEERIFDVLINDISIHSLTLDTTGLPGYIQIVDNKLSFHCPDSVSYDFSFEYQAFDSENGYFTTATEVFIKVEDKFRAPIAVTDSLVYDFADTVYVYPLENDINYQDTDLVMENNDTVFKYIFNELYFTYFNRWNERKYRCKNVGSDLLSNESICYYRIRPPDSLGIRDHTFKIRIGDTLVFNPRSYTNLPDSVYLSARTLNDIGEVEMINDQVFFYINFEALPYYYETIYNGGISEIIECIYVFKYNEINVWIYQQFEVNIQIEDLSYLDVNHFSIPIMPFGINLNRSFKPSHKYLKADNLMENIQPWVADENIDEGNVHFSGDYWISSFFDFYPGPIANNYDSDYNSKYHRTWEVTKDMIDDHISRFAESDYQIPEVIENWPAGPLMYNGNQYEQADYVDKNNNGIYDPENGDYPKISGDQAVLFIINDYRFGRSYNDDVDSLGVDIYAMYYAFNRPGSDLFQNTFFIKYKIINKSENDYMDFRLGQFVTHGDYNRLNQIGCDTVLNTFYTYPVSGFCNPKYISTTTFLNTGLGKFLTFGDVDNYSIPKYASMMGLYEEGFYFFWRPLWYDWAPLDYVFPSKIDDPYGQSALTFDQRGWINATGSGDGVGSSDAIEFLAGETHYFELAYSVYYNDQDGLFELVENGLNQVSQLHECYQNDSVPGGGSFTGIKEVSNNSNIEILVYPNPARTLLYVVGATGATEYSIYTLQGQKIEEGGFENEVSIEHLSEGFYILQVRSLDSKLEWTGKFVKQ